jgi:hypothetical protein
VFVFNIGKEYGPQNEFSPMLFSRHRKKLERTPNIPHTFLEAKEAFHVPLKYLMNVKADRVVEDIHGKKMKLRPRAHRIFKLLSK